MQSKRLFCAAFTVFYVFNTVSINALARVPMSRDRDYAEPEIRLYYPDKSMQDTIRMLKESSEKFLSSKDQNQFLESIKNNPYNLDVKSYDKFGDKARPGRVRFVEVNGKIVRHFIPATEDHIYIVLDKKLFSEVPMTFLEDHMKQFYEPHERNRKVSIMWDTLVTSQSVYSYASKLTTQERDLMAKSIVMGTTYNRKLHEMTESAFDNFLGNNSKIQNPNEQILTQDLIDKLLPLRNKAVVETDQLMDKIVAELSLLDVIIQYEQLKDEMKISETAFDGLSRETIAEIKEAWDTAKGNRSLYKVDTAEEFLLQIKEKMPLILKKLGKSMSPDALLRKQLFDRFKHRKDVWHEAREEMLQRVLEKNFQFNDITYGRVELTSIDKKIIFRMRPHGTERVFLWTPTSLLKANSKHFKQYLARQFIDSGSDRTDGESGRDTVIVWVDEIPKEMGEIERQQPLLYSNEKAKDDVKVKHIHEFNRPKAAKTKDFVRKPVDSWKRTRKYLSAYGRATYKETNKSDAKLGIFCASLQMLVVSAVQGLNMYLGNQEAFNYMTLVVQGAFGGIIGMNSSTYQNWIYRTGTRADSEMKVKTMQTLKISTNSVLYVFFMGLSTDSLKSVKDIIHKALNIIGNSYGKAEINQPAVILREARADTKIFKIRVPVANKTIDTGVSWSKINFQIIAQNIILMLRMLDLLKVKANMWGRDVFIGPIVFWSSIPIVKRLTLWWAEKKQPEMAKEMKLRENWENYIFNPFAIHKTVAKIVRKPYDLVKGYGHKKSFVSYVNGWEDSLIQPIEIDEFGRERVISTAVGSCKEFFSPGFAAASM